MVVEAENNETNKTTRRSERRSALKNSLTEPTLLEMSGNPTYQDLRTAVQNLTLPSEDLSHTLFQEGASMQPWIDKHPVLFAISDVVFVYCAVALVVSWWSGWAALARHYRCRSEFIGSRWRFQSGEMRWLCGYSNCLTIGANSEGLYLSVLPPFRLFHPPLFIPWKQVSFVRKSAFFQRGVRFALGSGIFMPLWVRERTAERIKVAAGQSYPVETLG